MERVAMLFYLSFTACTLFENSVDTYTLNGENEKKYGYGDKIYNLKQNTENNLHQEMSERFGLGDVDKKIPEWKDAAFEIKEYLKNFMNARRSNSKKKNRRTKRATNVDGWWWDCPWCEGSKAIITDCNCSSDVNTSCKCDKANTNNDDTTGND